MSERKYHFYNVSCREHFPVNLNIFQIHVNITLRLGWAMGPTSRHLQVRLPGPGILLHPQLAIKFSFYFPHQTFQKS